MKTRLYTRKRALISSVAMLLVAMIALGTATFAWFTKSTTATANGINVKTVKASNLQICSSVSDWSTTVNYGIAAQILQPASTIDGKNWYSTEAQDASKYERQTTPSAATVEEVSTKFISSLAEGESAPTGDVYYVKDQLNIRNAGVADVNNVTIDVTFPTGDKAKYLRIAFQEVDAKGHGDTVAFVTSSPKLVFADSLMADSTTKYDAYKNTTPETQEITPVTTRSYNIGKLIGSGTTDSSEKSARYFNVYVWFEGQDTDCYANNGGIELSSTDIQFKVSGETVQS